MVGRTLISLLAIAAVSIQTCVAQASLFGLFRISHSRGGFLTADEKNSLAVFLPRQQDNPLQIWNLTDQFEGQRNPIASAGYLFLTPSRPEGPDPDLIPGAPVVLDDLGYYYWDILRLNSDGAVHIKAVNGDTSLFMVRSPADGKPILSDKPVDCSEVWVLEDTGIR